MNATAVAEQHVDLTVDGDDVTVRYLAAGDGPPLVFCHGIGLDAAGVSWRRVLPALAEERSVYALDFPGHGGSDAPRRTYTTNYYVNALSAFLDELGLDGAGLVGISMGGAVALGHALDGGSPERLALVDSYGLGADAYWCRAASVALRVPFAGDALWGSVSTKAGVRSNVAALSGGSVPEDLVDDVYRSATRDSMRALRSWQRHEFTTGGLRTNFSDRLAELDAPTLLVHGEDDPLLPVRWSRNAVDRLSDARLQIYEDCGHWPPRERPAEFEETLRSFVGA